MPIGDRALGAVRAEAADAASARAAAFARLLLVAAAVHGWIMALDGEGHGLEPVLFASAIALSVTGIAALRSPPPRLALLVAFGVMLVRLGASFPHVYNHLFLEMLLVGAAAATRRGDAAEDQLLLDFTRGVVVIVLFWSGLQKLLHGCYFEGQFLAVSIASNEYFATPFSWLAPGEVERLRGLLPLRIGAGPFRLEAPALVALSNLVWILELVLPIGLLVRRLRPVAVVATIALLVAIEIAAREIVFGILFGGGVLLFAPGRTFERATPWLAAALLGALATQVWRPDVWIN